jgi:citrate synthase
MSSVELPRLTTAQAAARLGIKIETLYAYVSRGRLTRRRGPDGSTFDPLEVESFARMRRSSDRPPQHVQGHAAGTPLMAIDQDITLLEDDRLYFRGREAGELARSATFDQVCWWLWTREWQPGVVLEASPSTAEAVGALPAALTRRLSLCERMQLAVTLMAAADPLRHDLSVPSVARMAGELIAGVVLALPAHARTPRAAARADDASIAARLWSRLSSRRPTPTDVALLNAALVLLVDHDLAASTLAVRAAASARAHPYAVVSCGLGALDSALHGNVSRAAATMLRRRIDGEPADRVVAEAVIDHGTVPGFGHRVYRAEDPRWTIVAEMIERARPDAAAPRAAADLCGVVARRARTFPNVDLALAVLAETLELRPDATELIFALARVGGWITHALAEYAEPPLRLRPEGRYVGP